MLSCHMLSSPPGLLPFGWLVVGHLFVSCLNLEASIEGQEVAFLFSLDQFTPLSLVDVYPSLQSQPIRSVVSEEKKKKTFSLHKPSCKIGKSPLESNHQLSSYLFKSTAFQEADGNRTLRWSPKLQISTRFSTLKPFL